MADTVSAKLARSVPGFQTRERLLCTPCQCGTQTESRLVRNISDFGPVSFRIDNISFREYFVPIHRGRHCHAYDQGKTN